MTARRRTPISGSDERAGSSDEPGSGDGRIGLHRRSLHPAVPRRGPSGAHDAAQFVARARGAVAPEAGRRRQRRPVVIRRRRSRAGRRLAGGGCRLRLRASRRLALPARRAETRGRTDRSRPRRRAEGAEGGPHGGRSAGRPHLLVRGGGLRAQRRRPRPSTRRVGPTRTPRASAPTPSRRRSPSARPGILSARRAASSFPSSIRLACSARFSGPICRPRSSIVSA